jgi:hypothetical protein
MKVKQDVRPGNLCYCKRSHYVIKKDANSQHPSSVNIEILTLCIVADIEYFDNELRFVLIVDGEKLIYLYKNIGVKFEDFWEVIQ